MERLRLNGSVRRDFKPTCIRRHREAISAFNPSAKALTIELCGELIAESEADPALVAELNEISALWREGAPERGFTMELGQDVEGEQADFVIALARERSGRVAGFLRFVPVYGAHPGYSLDLMRRRPDSANGITEYLIARAALGLGARGFSSLSLNFAAWGRLLDSAENAGLSGRLQRAMAKGLNPFFQIQSLRDFNQKFDPRWVPRAVVIDDVSDLPRIALLYASVEGFLDLPLVGRLLEPPLQISLVMGVLGGIRPTPRNVTVMSDQIPGGPEGPNQWQVIGISRDQWKLLGSALVLGGNVRAGVEDNLYLPDGTMCRSNGDLIGKARQMAEDVGRRPATVAEARELLGITARSAAPAA